ncbi:MAG: hypothetical protein U0804_28505 [Gemmataceae bacterium]
MATRLLRDGILDSAAVNALSFQAEVFYRRLMSVVDDFGRFDGRAAVLRGRLYSLKLDTVREADITRWIAECEKAGLIALYAVEGKPFILFHKLGPARAKESKYPPPPADVAARRKRLFAAENICAQMQTDANGCSQAFADVPDSGSDASAETNANPTGGAALPPPAADPPPAKPRTRKEPTGPHAEAVRLFCDGWQATHDGTKYPFSGGKDGAAVKDILAAVDGDLGRFRVIVERYLANTDSFYAGHPLSLLRSQLPKFMVEVSQQHHPPRNRFETQDDRVMGTILGALE